MSQKSRNQIEVEINAEIISNNERLVTAEILNGILSDINDSTINKLSDSSSFGLFEYDTSQTYTVGQCVVWSNQLWKANVLVEGGSFDKTKWILQSPTKEWKVKLTGQDGSLPTINIIKDDLFGINQPNFTRLGTGSVVLDYSQDVFSGTYSVSFDGTTQRDYAFPSFAMSTEIDSVTNNISFTDINGTLSDSVVTYYTLTIY